MLPSTAPRFVPRLSQRRSFFGQLKTEPADEEESVSRLRGSIIEGLRKTSEAVSSMYSRLANFSQRRKTAPDVNWVRPESLVNAAGAAAPPQPTTAASILGGPGSLSRNRHMTFPATAPSKRHDHPEVPPPSAISARRGTGASAASSKWEIVRSLVTAPVVPEADAAMAVRDAGGGDMPKILLNWKARIFSDDRSIRVLFVTCNACPSVSEVSAHCLDGNCGALNLVAADTEEGHLLLTPPPTLQSRSEPEDRVHEGPPERRMVSLRPAAEEPVRACHASASLHDAAGTGLTIHLLLALVEMPQFHCLIQKQAIEIIALEPLCLDS